MPRRTVPAPSDQIARLLGATVVRVAELEALGLHRDTIAHRCRPGGPWRRMCPGVVLLSNAAPDRDDRRRAALLRAGPGAVITGLDAITLHGLHRIPQPHGPVHTLVPNGRRVTSHGLVMIERTLRLPDAKPGRWPLAPLDRAVLDFARRTRDRDLVRSAIAEAVQRGMTRPGRLWVELIEGNSRGRALAREVLEEVSDGVRSVAEAKARELIRSSGLPQPRWNAGIVDTTGQHVAVPDAWWDDVGMAWEIDSYEFHLAPDDYADTLQRRRAMTELGVVVVAHTPSQIGAARRDVLRTLERHLVIARQRPRPPVYLAADPTSGTFVA